MAKPRTERQIRKDHAEYHQTLTAEVAEFLEANPDVPEERRDEIAQSLAANTPESIDAHVVEQAQVCDECGQTRAWHDVNQGTGLHHFRIG